MAEASIDKAPSWEITLTPQYDISGMVAEGISVHMIIDHPELRIKAQENLVLVTTKIGNIDLARFESGNVEAYDDQGGLELAEHEMDMGPVHIRLWRAVRETQGKIHILYKALHRIIDGSTRSGPCFDLHQDNGGLVAGGYGFLVVPQDYDGEYKISLQWDLGEAPPLTRAVWSFGEGPEKIKRKMPASSIQQTFFAVGNVKSSSGNSSILRSENFNLYWFGNPPFDVPAVADAIQILFFHMRKFFADDDDTFRVFIRCNNYPGRSGTAGPRSFILGYSTTQFDDPPTVESLSELLSHEMVHNWPILDDDNQGLDNWYSEGLAEYYSVFLRHRFGLTTDEDFLGQVNRKLTAYYTNTLVSSSNEELHKSTWAKVEAEAMPYARGFVFAIATDSLIRKTSNGARSLDTLVLALLSNPNPNIAAYLELLSKEVGEEVAHQMYEEMKSGRLIVPAPDSLREIEGVRLIRRDQQQWDLGFNESAILERSGCISGLRQGSRAAVAGLRNGDCVLQREKLHEAYGNPAICLKLRVKREEGEIPVIEFLPRSWEMVESYTYVREE